MNWGDEIKNVLIVAAWCFGFAGVGWALERFLRHPRVEVPLLIRERRRLRRRLHKMQQLFNESMQCAEYYRHEIEITRRALRKNTEAVKGERTWAEKENCRKTRNC